mgnify:CR=1 FL=1
MIPDHSSSAVIVSDFDGTLTRHDVYQLIAERLLPAATPDYWSEYRAGRTTHFEALRGYFAAARGGEAELDRLLDDVDLEPNLPGLLSRLRAGGWDVVVVSAGCRWYIDRVLKRANVDLEVHANPGRIDPSGHLVMDLPDGSPYFSREYGIDKAAVVRAIKNVGKWVAFAGDGPPDLEAALLVTGTWRFARRSSALAEALEELGEPYQPFEAWSEIVDAILEPKAIRDHRTGG